MMGSDQTVTDADLRAKLLDDRAVIGTWSIVASPTAVEIAARAGLDFVILDLEHGAWDFGTLEAGIRAAEGAGAAPFIRVPDLTPSTFQRVLDLGAHGVIVPQVRTPEDAAKAVACARFAPEGLRGYNPFTRCADYAAPATSGTGKLAPDFVQVGIIIENAEAYAALGAICATPGLSIVYLGVYDMSLALGCNGDVRDPRVDAFVHDSTATARAAGKTVGVMVRSVADIDAALAYGARMLVWGVDSNVLHQAYRAPADHLRAARSGKS